MIQLLDFRNEFGNEDGDRERRSFRRMNGKIQGSYHQLYHGPYKKEVREHWLERLLEIQKNIQLNGPEEFRDFEIITLPEMRNIRRIWVFDKHEFDDSVPTIYERAIGKAFDDPEWMNSESFGAQEWDILKEVCKESAPDEELAFELMYSLVDIENRASSMNERKGILDSLEDSIKSNYYQNEEDATQFYSEKINRKKDMGGKYDERFLYELHEKLAEYYVDEDEKDLINDNQTTDNA